MAWSGQLERTMSDVGVENIWVGRSRYIWKRGQSEMFRWVSRR